MKKLTNTNHNPPAGYELFMDVRDMLGRNWKLAAFPVRSGSVAFFSKLSDYVSWVREVNEIRALQRGELSFKERVMNEVYCGNINFSIAGKMMER